MASETENHRPASPPPALSNGSVNGGPSKPALPEAAPAPAAATVVGSESEVDNHTKDQPEENGDRDRAGNEDSGDGSAGANGGANGTAHPAATPAPAPAPAPAATQHAAPEDSEDEGSASSPIATAPLRMTMSPPYWLLHEQQVLGDGGSSRSGNGSPSAAAAALPGNASTESLPPVGAITLQDNETLTEDEDGSANGNANGNGNGVPGHRRRWQRQLQQQQQLQHGRDRSRACWARSVEVTDYVVVNGGPTSIGAFAVWNIKVETLTGTTMTIRKRYSEFDDFRRRLVATFPGFEAAVPVLPPKSAFAKFRAGFLERRRAGLQYFLNCILLNPEFAMSPVLRDFLFS